MDSNKLSTWIIQRFILPIQPLDLEVQRVNQLLCHQHPPRLKGSILDSASSKDQTDCNYYKLSSKNTGLTANVQSISFNFFTSFHPFQTNLNS